MRVKLYSSALRKPLRDLQLLIGGLGQAFYVLLAQALLVKGEGSLVLEPVRLKFALD